MAPEQRCPDCPARYANGGCGHCDEGQGSYEEAVDPTVLDICVGEGKWLASYGTHEGMPAIFYEPSPAPGPVGEVCTLDLPKDALLPGAVAMRFTTREAVYLHIDLCLQMLRKSSGVFK